MSESDTAPVRPTFRETGTLTPSRVTDEPELSHSAVSLICLSCSMISRYSATTAGSGSVKTSPLEPSTIISRSATLERESFTPVTAGTPRVRARIAACEFAAPLRHTTPISLSLAISARIDAVISSATTMTGSVTSNSSTSLCESPERSLWATSLTSRVRSRM